MFPSHDSYRGDGRQRGSAGVEEFENAGVKLPLLVLELRQVLPGHRPAAERIRLDSVRLDGRNSHPARIPVINGCEAVELINAVRKRSGLNNQRRFKVSDI